MKLNFNRPIMGLDGKEVENTNIGKILAQSIQNQTDGDAIKQWEWAKSLYTTGILDLDKSDQAKFKEFVSKPNQFTAIVKAQALEVFEDAEKMKKVS